MWPIQKVGWRKDFPLNAKLALALSAVSWMAEEIKQNRERVPNSTIVLYKAFKIDDYPNIRAIARASLVPITEEYDPKLTIYNEEGPVKIKEIID